MDPYFLYRLNFVFKPPICPRAGEVSIEFKKGEEKKPEAAPPCCAARGLSRGDYHEEGCASLPRTRLHQVYHKKQPSLPGICAMFYLSCLEKENLHQGSSYV
jgi:hypothetical protein